MEQPTIITLTATDKLTAKEIISLLDEQGLTPEKIWNDDYPYFDEGKIDQIYQEVRDGKGSWDDYRAAVKADKARTIESYGIAGGFVKESEEGGGEGEGEHVELVIYFPYYNIYLAANASYYSHHGIDYWEPFYEVVPKQVQVTQYFAVK